ncbi:AraC family transcriptional regulator [Thalassotalea profundi]|uniref:Transcriptional regulator n=1 Tax=Thalassotalea profundi TaxID=2036687 RepID=A0ABQ3IKM6_9GAMM|nr:helix-turn-helix domain-containing protein [Thalassotalea profundi]GHE86623.1 transcriptional regulator [Thalassotalea profundi]
MFELLTHFAIAQMLFCILVLLPQQQKNPSIRLYILLMLCGVSYCLGEIHPEKITHSFFWWFSHIGGNVLPGVFWLVSLSVFGDHTKLKRWQYALASMTLLIPLTYQAIQYIMSFNADTSRMLELLFGQSALLLELALIVHAFVVASKYWRDDLVQERRYIRGAVISLSAVYLILKIVADQLLNIDWQGIDIINSLLLVVLVTGINYFLFQLRTSSLFETVNVTPQKRSPNKKLSKELLRITASMTDEKLYQQDGITIAELAKHLGIHEYKLRNLINGELNYRNFNDFLNHYRIAEVSEKLIDSEFSTTPVLTLALESGFRSLSSFNKAFKATHGQTPTEFRKKTLSNL